MLAPIWTRMMDEDHQQVLHARFGHYGFALAMPATLLGVVLVAGVAVILGLRRPRRAAAERLP